MLEGIFSGDSETLMLSVTPSREGEGGVCAEGGGGVCAGVCCSVLQCVAVCCSASQSVAVFAGVYEEASIESKPCRESCRCTHVPTSSRSMDSKFTWSVSLRRFSERPPELRGSGKGEWVGVGEEGVVQEEMVLVSLGVRNGDNSGIHGFIP